MEKNIKKINEIIPLTHGSLICLFGLTFGILAASALTMDSFSLEGTMILVICDFILLVLYLIFSILETKCKKKIIKKLTRISLKNQYQLLTEKVAEEEYYYKQNSDGTMTIVKFGREKVFSFKASAEEAKEIFQL